MAARDERLRILSSLRDAMTASLSVFDRARAAGGSAKNGAEAVNTAITQFDVGYEDVKRRSTAHQLRSGMTWPWGSWPPPRTRPWRW